MNAFTFQLWFPDFFPTTPYSLAVLFFQTTLLILMGLAFDRICQRYSATLKSQMWLGIILVIPFLIALSATIPATPINYFVADLIELKDYTQNQTAPELQPSNEEMIAGVGAAVETGIDSTESLSVTYRSFVVAIYWFIVSILLGRIGLGIIKLHFLRVSSVRVIDHHRHTLKTHTLEAVINQFGRKKHCCLRFSNKVSSPITYGVFWPVILLPSKGLESVSESQLHSILLHEYSHIQSHDPLKLLLVSCIESLFFFQPLIWFAGKKFRAYSEMAADDAVTSTGVSSKQYSGSLVEFAERLSQKKIPSQLALGMFSSTKPLASRIQYILNKQCNHDTHSGFRKIIAAFFVVVAIATMTVQFTPKLFAATQNNASTGLTYVMNTPVELIHIPQGEFTMGATEQEVADWYEFVNSEWPNMKSAAIDSAAFLHKVYLDSYYIFKYEVTNEQYVAYTTATGKTPHYGSKNIRLNAPDQPAVYSSWEDANGFCEWADARLPTEAEWEKAARGTERLKYPWGNQWQSRNLHAADVIAGKTFDDLAQWREWAGTQDQHKINSNSIRVGSYPQGASPYGVMDMAGNAWEWVADWYDPNYYRHSPTKNPTGPASGTIKVVRGGGWIHPSAMTQAWVRHDSVGHPSQYFVMGFRCVVDAVEN